LFFNIWISELIGCHHKRYYILKKKKIADIYNRKEAAHVPGKARQEAGPASWVISCRKGSFAERSPWFFSEGYSQDIKRNLNFK
jgi:hypothetical protein